MKLNKSLFFISIVSFILLLSSCRNNEDSNVEKVNDQANNQVEDEMYEWDYSLHVSNIDQSYGPYIDEFSQEVEKETDGKMKITPRLADELPFSTEDAVNAVGDGTIELADVTMGFAAGS